VLLPSDTYRKTIASITAALLPFVTYFLILPHTPHPEDCKLSSSVKFSCVKMVSEHGLQMNGLQHACLSSEVQRLFCLIKQYNAVTIKATVLNAAFTTDMRKRLLLLIDSYKFLSEHTFIS
jgi:hypothetical protein